MKILVDARTLGKRPSGVGMYIYNFVCGLMLYENIEIQLVTDITESTEIKKLEEAHIPIHKYGTHIEKSVGVYAYFRFVQKIIHEIKPDIFWEGNNLIPAKIKNPYGKIVVTIHDIFPITIPECYSKIYQYYFRIGLGKTVRNVDAIIYDSKDTKKELQQYYPKAVSKQSHVSYIVVDDLPEFVAENKGYYLYIGNMEKRKGTDLLLKAYVQYRKRGGKKELRLGGKIRSDEIENLLGECQKEVDGIRYLGYIDTQKKYELYAGCDAFVFPSRGEGFGMPVIEALNYGKAVIASDLEIFKEIAGEAVSYFSYSESDDEAVESLTDALLTQNEADMELCYEVVQKYKVDKLTGKLEQFFEELLKEA